MIDSQTKTKQAKIQATMIDRQTETKQTKIQAIKLIDKPK